MNPIDSAYTTKTQQWAIEAFGGLGFNELLAREMIKARTTGDERSLSNAYKALRQILK